MPSKKKYSINKIRLYESSFLCLSKIRATTNKKATVTVTDCIVNNDCCPSNKTHNNRVKLIVNKYNNIINMNHNQMNMHVPMNTVGATPNVGMQMQVPGTIMQQQSPQQMQVQQPQPMPQPTQQDKMDNISKVKTLMGSLRESIPMTLKSAAQILHQNHNVDSNSQKSMDNPVPRFDKNLEEFFSICDQMELHLESGAVIINDNKSGKVSYIFGTVISDGIKWVPRGWKYVTDEAGQRTATTCIQQAQSAAHYLPLSVMPSRLDSGPTTQETTLSYPQYLNTVRLQISYAKDIHDTLVAAAQNISPTE